MGSKDQQDGGPPSPDAAAPDAYVPTGEFCDGVNKAEMGNQGVAPVAMTTSHVAMGCCDGAMVDVHTRAAFGHNLVVFIRAYSLWEPGEWDLSQTGDGPEDGPEVGVAWEGDPWDPWYQPGPHLSGYFRMEQPGHPYLDPSLLSFCITVEDPESDLQGARLHAEDLVLMPWGWSERFTLHLLQDPDLSAVDAAGMDLESLALSMPMLNLVSLRYYVWSEHRFVLDPARAGIIANEVGEPPSNGLPFVIALDDHPLYLGSFMSPVSSATFAGPTILLPPADEREYVIDPSYPVGGPVPTPDLRDDLGLYTLLETSGKLVP